MSLRPLNPAPCHSRHGRPYFEGWYFKQASAGGAFSVIPGVFYGRSGGDTAFVQLIFGEPAQSHFIRYPISGFHYDTKSFEVSIGKNFFSMNRVLLDIGEIGLTASLSYSGHVRLWRSLWSPTIMGPFSYLPAMQCSHEVLSLTHRVSGSVAFGSRRIEFQDADGYMEKDWGGAFPESWFWMQCSRRDAALMCSAASIPFAGLSFTGLICALLYGGRQYRFATYNGAKLISLASGGPHVEAEIARGGYRLRISAHSGALGTLKAPTPSGMDRDIMESITARYEVALAHQGKTLFEDCFQNGGLEMLNPEALAKRSE